MHASIHTQFPLFANSILPTLILQLKRVPPEIVLLVDRAFECCKAPFTLSSKKSKWSVLFTVGRGRVRQVYKGSLAEMVMVTNSRQPVTLALIVAYNLF